jgi:hypothetical protein
MIRKLLFLLIIFPITIFGQTKLTSTHYNYSFIIPDGWYAKDKIYNPNVDSKIVDGKGNSFIVAIQKFPTSTKLTATQQMSGYTNEELEEQFNAVYGTTKVVKRGTVFVGLKEFYYIHLLTPFQDGYQLYHKQFLYCEGSKMLSFDACSNENYLDETTPAFAIMIDTFKFNNLSYKAVKK